MEHQSTVSDLQTSLMRAQEKVKSLSKSLDDMTWERDRLAFELENLRASVKWEKTHIAGLYLQIEELQDKLGMTASD